MKFAFLFVAGWCVTGCLGIMCCSVADNIEERGRIVNLCAQRSSALSRLVFMSPENINAVMRTLQDIAGLVKRNDVVARMELYDASMVLDEREDTTNDDMGGLPWTMTYHRLHFLKKNPDLWE